MPKKKNYTCIRCGYETNLKPNMQRHLYQTKKQCPQTNHLIELTDEIKQHILVNRIYIIPKAPKITNITMNNTMNNYIGNMDTFDKLNKYTEYKGVEIVDFDESVDQKLAVRANNMRTNTTDAMILKKATFIEHINEVSRNDIIEDFNVLYDHKMKTFAIYNEGVWKKLSIKEGLHAIIFKIQDIHWDLYELYLIRKIHKIGLNQISQSFKERLIEYYEFIGSFEVDSNIKDRSDKNILYDEIDDDNVAGQLSTTYWKLYLHTREAVSKREKQRVNKEVVDIIKRNTTHNINEMNKQIIQLFNMDETFKKMILGN